MAEPRRQRLKLDPQTTAWIVVLTGFVIFCVLCAAGTLGTYWFLFQSPTSVTVHLTVSRGTVTVNTNFVSTAIGDGMENVQPNTTLQTSSDAQSYLTFEDPYSKQTVATVFLLPNSNLQLIEATRPRFEWSQRAYVVQFGDALGHFTVDIPGSGSRAITLAMQSAIGTVRLDQNGSYAVDSLAQYLRLYTDDGKGLLYESGSRAWQVERGMIGTLTQGAQDAAVVPYPAENIIVQDISLWNTDQAPTVSHSFGDDNGSDAFDPKLPPTTWRCNNSVDDQNEPTGSWVRERIEHRIALHIQRRNQTGTLSSHAETGCEFWFKSQANIPTTPIPVLTATPVPAITPTVVPALPTATPLPLILATEPATATGAATVSAPAGTAPALAVTEQVLPVAAKPATDPSFGPVAANDDSPNGWIVSGYKSLSIQLRMKIAYQDVPTCGVQGTECPVMLFLEYYDSDTPTTLKVWRQGFYAQRPPDDTSLQRCDTCPHDHVQIKPNAWFIYDSGDLFNEFLENKKPVSIVRIRIYSSGHQFDVAVSDLAVLGGL